MKKHILIVAILIGFIKAEAQEASELIVQVENIKEVKGSLKIAIYDQEKDFLKKEVLWDGKEIESNKVEFTFKDLPVGSYAISLFHDENDNGKMDSNFIGIPTEPYAFSNNAKGRFGPPSFEDCRFEVKDGTQKIVISL